MKTIRKVIAGFLAYAFALSITGPAFAQAVNPSGTTGYNGPVIIGSQAGGLAGSYYKSLASGTMAAGLAANAPVFSFRYGGTGYAIIKNVTVSVANGGTAFTAGTANLSMYAARAFTASDSGGTAGTLTGNNGKLRTSFGTTNVADFRIASTAALTAGTRTLDTDPIANFVAGIPATTANYQIVNPVTSYQARDQAGDYPFTLANNEGFVIQANVPATGTWSFTVTVIWDEFATY